MKAFNILGILNNGFLNSFTFTLLSEELTRDIEFVKEIFKNNATIYTFLDETLKMDPEILRICVWEIPERELIKEIPPVNDKELMCHLMKHKESYLEYASDELKADREFFPEEAKRDDELRTLYEKLYAEKRGDELPF